MQDFLLWGLGRVNIYDLTGASRLIFWILKDINLPIKIYIRGYAYFAYFSQHMFSFQSSCVVIKYLTIDLQISCFEQNLRFICCSFFSPLLKSITSKRDADFTVNGEYIEEREDFIEHLESQFLYLAADARATLRFGTFKNSVSCTCYLLLRFWCMFSFYCFYGELNPLA